MPRKTFFNLDPNKQNTLINALEIEFSRVSLHDASIANIVKEAGIPRGSFYQYFEDKEDAFLYVLQRYAKKNQDNFKTELKQSEGDLFVAFLAMFQLSIKEFQNSNNRQFFRNAFLNMNHKVEEVFTRNQSDVQTNKMLLEVRTLVNMDKLNITTEDEFINVMHILSGVTLHNVIRAFARQLSPEEAWNNYQIEINLLKNGLEKI